MSMEDTTTMVADAMRLDLAHSEKRFAFAAYCGAQDKIKLADVEIRRATLHTTAFEHVENGKLFALTGKLSDREHDIVRLISHYVATGRSDK